MEDEEMLAEMRKGPSNGAFGPLGGLPSAQGKSSFPHHGYGHDSPPKAVWGGPDQANSFSDSFSDG